MTENANGGNKEFPSGVAKERALARAFVYGLIEGRVLDKGRKALWAGCPIHSNKALQALGLKGNEQEAWTLTYDGGDKAVLTWTDTQEKEAITVSKGYTKKSKEEIQRLVIEPERWPH